MEVAISAQESMKWDFLMAQQRACEEPTPNKSAALLSELHSDGDLRRKIEADPKTAFRVVKYLPYALRHICRPYVEQVITERKPKPTVH